MIIGLACLLVAASSLLRVAGSPSPDVVSITATSSGFVGIVGAAFAVLRLYLQAAARKPTDALSIDSLSTTDDER